MRGPPSRRGRPPLLIDGLTTQRGPFPVSPGNYWGISPGAVVCRSVVSPVRSRFAGLRYMRRWADPENSPRRLCGVAWSLVAHNRRLCRVLDALGSPDLIHHYQRRRRRWRQVEGEWPGGWLHRPSPRWSNRRRRPPPRRRRSRRPRPHRPRSTTDTTPPPESGPPPHDRSADHHDRAPPADDGPASHHGPAHHQCPDDDNRTPSAEPPPSVALVRGGDAGLGKPPTSQATMLTRRSRCRTANRCGTHPPTTR